mgnify:CR=1 FL=1
MLMMKLEQVEEVLPEQAPSGPNQLPYKKYYLEILNAKVGFESRLGVYWDSEE